MNCAFRNSDYFLVCCNIRNWNEIDSWHINTSHHTGMYVDPNSHHYTHFPVTLFCCTSHSQCNMKNYLRYKLHRSPRPPQIPEFHHIPQAAIKLIHVTTYIVNLAWFWTSSLLFTSAISFGVYITNVRFFFF